MTLICGVFYYKNLSQISVVNNKASLAIDELRIINQQVASTAFYLRQNFNSDLTDWNSKKVKIAELQKLMTTISKTSPGLNVPVTKIRSHFEVKLKIINDFELSLIELRESVNDLLPTYTELDKKNIKFILEKRDFYRECLLDVYMYISFPHKDNELRILEDQKVLGQILNFATTPSAEIQKLSNHIQVILKRSKDINSYLTIFKEDSIQNEIKAIDRYYQNTIEEKVQQNENLLTFMMAALGVYLIFMILLLLKK